MSYRRRHIEVFSMSMLDTVTCSLGGAIILTLFIASLVPENAKLIFEPLPPVVNSGQPAHTALPPIGLVTVYFTPSGAAEFQPDEMEPTAEACPDVAANFEVALNFNRTAPFDPLSSAREMSLSVFVPTMAGVQPQRPECLRITPPEASCTFQYVTDGHSSARAPCPGPSGLEFKLLKDQTAYELTDP